MSELLAKKAKILLMLLSCILLANNAQAVSCYEQSGELDRVGENAYFSLELSDRASYKDLKVVEEFYNELEGDWVGSYVYRVCVGSESNARDRFKKGKVAVEVSQKSGSIIKIRSDVDYEDNRSGLFTRDTLGKDYIFLVEVNDDNELIVSERYRRGSGVGAVLVETVWSVDVAESTAKINAVVYMNGYFAEEETWNLKRK